MGEAVYWSEVVETDYGEVPGMERLRSDVRDLPTDSPEFWQLMQGYQYQLAQTEILHRRGEVQSVERPYVGHSGVTRRADIETVGGDYIDCKAYATNYNPPENKKQQFRAQAADYARSGRRVTYYFSQNPPQWARNILDELGLRWEIRN